MEKSVLQPYKNELNPPSSRRIEAHLIDAFLIVIISFLLLMLSHLILDNSSFYKQKEIILTQEMVKCYEIEEEAKIFLMIMITICIKILEIKKKYLMNIVINI